MSLRERALIFAAAAFLLVSLINTLFLDPLLAKQRKLSDQVVQKQEKMKEVRAQIEELLQARRDDANSPQRRQLSQARQQIAEGDAYLQSLRDRLVQPAEMVGLLQQVLKKNGQLELVSLQTLPAVPLLEKPAAAGAKPAEAKAGDAKPQAAPTADAGHQVFTHRVTLTVRGNYADLLQYLTTLEHLPGQMFWGEAKMDAAHYPAVELTLTLFTLSLDKTWLMV